METNGKPTNTSKLLGETIIIALITLVGYAIAFSYEAGYLDVFKIPASFAAIDITKALIAAASVGGLLIAAFFLLNLFAVMGLLDMSKPFSRRLAMSLIFFTYVVLYLLLFPDHWQNWIPSLLALTAWVFFELIWPIILFRKSGSWDERVSASLKAEKTVSDRGLDWKLINKIFTAFGVTPSLLVLSIFPILALSGSVGESTALRQDEFPLLCDQKNWALVRNYGSIGLFVQFDNEKNLTGKFQAINMANPNPTCLEIVKTGNLKQPNQITPDNKTILNNLFDKIKNVSYSFLENIRNQSKNSYKK